MKKIEDLFWKYAPSVMGYSIIVAMELAAVAIICWLCKCIITTWR